MRATKPGFGIQRFSIPWSDRRVEAHPHADDPAHQGQVSVSPGRIVGLRQTVIKGYVAANLGAFQYPLVGS